jgi:hypothetical protein
MSPCSEVRCATGWSGGVNPVRAHSGNGLVVGSGHTNGDGAGDPVATEVVVVADVAGPAAGAPEHPDASRATAATAAIDERIERMNTPLRRIFTVSFRYRRRSMAAPATPVYGLRPTDPLPLPAHLGWST